MEQQLQDNHMTLVPQGDQPQGEANHGDSKLDATMNAAPSTEVPSDEGLPEDSDSKVAVVGMNFSQLLLRFSTEVVGEPDTGDLTPVLIEDALRAGGIVLRDQANGNVLQPALDDMGAFLRQCVAAGAMVHLPQPGDIVVMQYNVSRLFWSAVVESVAATDLGVLISLPPVQDRETEFQRATMKRGGLNDAWRVRGFIRL